MAIERFVRNSGYLGMRRLIFQNTINSNGFSDSQIKKKYAIIKRLSMPSKWSDPTILCFDKFIQRRM